ncbi:MAG: hypothetical protein AB7U30_05925 [Sulfuricellaceae bacterium]|jgi:hypothetical protein
MTDEKAKSEVAMLRPAKNHVTAMVVHLAPEYVELLRYFQDNGGWIRLPEKLEALVKNLNLSNYVQLYEDERRIQVSLMFGLMGEEGYKKWSAELEAAGLEAQQSFLDDLTAEMATEESWEWLEDFFPGTPEEEEAQRQLFESLAEDEKQQAIRQAQFFWGFFFAQFYNVLSLMIHGRKLTSLVPRAMAGDDDALCKAIQIDPRLLSLHPYFHERRLKALNEGDGDLLARIGYRLANPGSRGKIRYPGLYMVFSMLEAANWLSDFSHAEILDLCDAAALDRYQNRIEDVNYVTKRLREYRRMQKTGGLSMH